jgi:hypothetical protein
MATFPVKLLLSLLSLGASSAARFFDDSSM